MSINVPRVCYVFYVTSVCSCVFSMVVLVHVVFNVCSYFSVTGYKGAEGA